MEKELLFMTLPMINERYPKVLDEFAARGKLYCTRLFDCGEEYNRPPIFLGSGTFVRIGGCPGILTNDHVFPFVGRNWIYVPDYKTGLLCSLQLNCIVPLPSTPSNSLNIRGVDISFIEVKLEDAIKQLGYEIWDLDSSAEKYFAQKTLSCGKDVVNNWLWGVEVTPDEEVEKQDKNIDYYPRAGFHHLGPEEPVPFVATVKYNRMRFTKEVDELYCEIHRQGKDSLKLPKSYRGTSGAAVWKARGEIPAETITGFDLAGVLTEEVLSFNGQAVAVLCRGSDALYETFYKFCTHYLSHKNRMDALEYAGFSRKKNRKRK